MSGMIKKQSSAAVRLRKGCAKPFMRGPAEPIAEEDFKRLAFRLGFSFEEVQVLTRLYIHPKDPRK